MLRTEKREISGLQVITTQLPAMRAYRLGVRLLKTLGPLLGPALSGGASMAALLAADLSALADGLAQLDEGAADSLARDVLAATQVRTSDGLVELTSESNINQAFEGRLPALLGAIRFAIEVNFADFFAGSGSVVPGLGPKAQ